MLPQLGRHEHAIGNPLITLTYAFANAVAGRQHYVKAGNYGAIELVSSSSGTALNPIKFIGYTTTPGDIIATSWPKHTRAMFLLTLLTFQTI